MHNVRRKVPFRFDVRLIVGRREPREARICPHCRQGVEDAAHMVYDCPLYAPQRQRWHSLFPAHKPRLLTVFLAQDPYPLANFVAACRKQWERANAALAAAP